MIDPFIDGQVREGAISYGLSSFGYDIRVADEFRIFSAATGQLSVVDPKLIDERAMVHYQGDVCIIPPNSFALARTMEYFRIPRNVLTICLGKSTYARCFHGNTRVALVDGTAPTLEEMAWRAEDGELFWGYSIGQFGRVMVTLLEQPRLIGQDALIELTLDNGEQIACTPDHEFVMRDGRLLPADALRPGDSLMPLYRKPARGYEMVYQPSNRHLYPTHLLADEWNLRHGLYANTPGTHRHHIDFNQRNNRPTNIERMEAGAHVRLHNTENYGLGFSSEEHSAAIRAAYVRLRQDPDRLAALRASNQRKAQHFWSLDQYQAAREQLVESQLAAWTDERRTAQQQAKLRYYEDPAHRAEAGENARQVWSRDDGSRRAAQAAHAGQLRLRPEITAERVHWALDEAGSIHGAARLLDCDRTTFRRFPEVLSAFRGNRQADNHKITAIRSLPGVHDVYCLTVPEAGNFALESGVFVRNCGIIVNVTPFEPEWEGYVTIEISNTTPLPAKIYANEGIAQVLFFEGEQPDISYADRKGKYQKQTGITLPRP